MNQICLGYIPIDWKNDDNENNPGWITIGDDNGTICDCIEYENIFNSDSELSSINVTDGIKNLIITISDDLNGDEWRGVFAKINDNFFNNISVNGKKLNISNYIQFSWYILNDDLPEDEVLKNFGLKNVICIDNYTGGNEFENENGTYNGCIYALLKNEEQVDNDEDGNVYIFNPLNPIV